MTAMLELDAVDFAYPRSGRQGPPFAVHGLSLRLEHGEILGVLGPNASGKTTLVRLVSRVVAPSAGEIRLEGQRLDAFSRETVARLVAVVPQDAPAGFPHTVEELVLMGRFPHSPGRFFESREDRAIARDAMALTGVTALGTAPLDRLSGGERQRVMLARALAQQPRLLVLDEPTAHLDLRHQAECVALLRRLHRDSGLTVILVSHDLNLAGEVCHRLLLMTEGRAAMLGAPEAVLDPAVLEPVFRCQVEVLRHPRRGRPVVMLRWPERGDD
jgi:iron complex transport system ATP-binding protein